MPAATSAAPLDKRREGKRARTREIGRHAGDKARERQRPRATKSASDKEHERQRERAAKSASDRERERQREHERGRARATEGASEKETEHERHRAAKRPSGTTKQQRAKCAAKRALGGPAPEMPQNAHHACPAHLPFHMPDPPPGALAPPPKRADLLKMQKTLPFSLQFWPLLGLRAPKGALLPREFEGSGAQKGHFFQSFRPLRSAQPTPRGPRKGSKR